MTDKYFLNDADEPKKYLSVECIYKKLEYAELYNAIGFKTGNKGDNENAARTVCSVEDAGKFAQSILNLCDRIEKVNKIRIL